MALLGVVTCLSTFLWVPQRGREGPTHQSLLSQSAGYTIQYAVPALGLTKGDHKANARVPDSDCP